jgi:O-antigen ligase
VAVTATTGLTEPIPAARTGRARLAATSPEYLALVPATLVVGTLVVGLAFRLTAVELAASAAAFLTAIAFPYAGLAILAFAASLVPPPVVPAPGFHAILVGAILLGCVYRLPIERPRFAPSPVVAILGAYALYALVQQLPELSTGYASGAAHDVGFLYIQLLGSLGALVAAGYLLRDRSPYPILAMAVAGAALTAIVSLGSYNPNLTVAPILNLTAPSSDAGRATGSFSNPNYLGAFTAIMMTATFAVLVVVRSRPNQVLLAAATLALAIATALSLSRGAALAGLVGCTFVVIARWRRAGVLLLVLGLIAAAVAYPLCVQWRLESLTGSASQHAYLIMADSDAGRLAGVLAAPALFLTAPLFGIGFGHFVPYSIQAGLLTPINAHNWYLTVLAEQGVVGILLWAAVAIAAIDALRRRPDPGRQFGFAVLAALATAARFLEPPTTLQLIAAPLILLAAAAVADWSLRSSSRIERVGRAVDAAAPSVASRVRPARGT